MPKIQSVRLRIIDFNFIFDKLDERRDIGTAIQVFTRNDALALQKVGETGTIEPGKSTDFIVIKPNLLEIPWRKSPGRKE